MSQPAAEPIPHLEDHLGYWLRMVSNHVSNAFAQALQEHQVSVAEWVALWHIHHRQQVTPGELAALIGMTRGAISKVLVKLESKRWIVRIGDDDDNRMQWIRLTPAGKQILPELAQLANRNDEHYFGSLSQNEQAILRQLLEKLTGIHQWKNAPID